MVDTAIPILFAGARTVQCRARAGGGDIARSIAAFTLSSSIGFFPGGRVASRRRPSTPSAGRRSGRRHTARFDMPVSRPSASLPFCRPFATAAGRRCHFRKNGMLCFEQNTIASNKHEVFHIFPRRENFLQSAVRCHFQPPAIPQLPDLLHGHLASKAVVSRFDLVTDMALESTGETDCASAMLFSQGTPQLKPFLLFIS